MLGRGCAALVLMATALVGFATAEVAQAPSAEAVQASAGAARFKAIEWISWGSTPGEQIPNAGKTVTETSTIAGKRLAVTCSVRNIARASGTGTGNLLEAYRPGTWQGDGFDELYNRGGTGTANQMVVGLSNRTVSNTITFDFACSATLDGAVLPLSGLVMADAESSGNNEHVGATIPVTNPDTGLATSWRIIDRVRGNACTLAATARRTETGTGASAVNRLEMYGPANNTCEANAAQFPGPSAIAFMDNATSATQVTVAGGGKSAIALGVALDFDFGDAPVSYGEAVSAAQFNYSGGEVPLATGSYPANRGVNLFSGVTLATVTAPTPRLGATTDAELSQTYSAQANADDASPESGPDDEDAVSLASPSVVMPGGTFSTTVACTRSGAVGGNVAGWIDWNLNGTFDSGERSTQVVACPASGSLTLTWAVPNDLLPNGGTRRTFLRLRIAGTGDTINATGLTNVGEVEDHPLTVTTPPRLQVVKEVGQRVSPDDQFTVSATGGSLSGVSATTSGAATSAQTVVAWAQTGQSYTITDAMAPGSPNPLSDYTPAITCVDRGNGDAAVQPGGAAPNWTLSGLGTGQLIRCTIRNTANPAALDVSKSAVGVTGPAADGSFVATYDVTVDNAGPLPSTYDLTDTPAFAPNLQVLGATWTSTSTGAAPGGSATGAGPFRITSGQGIARNAEHTYRVAIRFRHTDRAPVSGCSGAGTGLFNRASLAAGQESGPGGNNTACTPPPAAATPSLELDKEASAVVDLDDNGPDAGDRIDFTFTVSNDGPVTVTALTIVDPLVAGVACPVTTLAPGGVTECSGSRTLTQDDVDAGAFNNTATARGRDPIGGPVSSAPDATSTPFVAATTLLLDKVASAPADTDGNGRVDAGDEISYTFTVTNTGATTVRDVRIVDDLVGAVTCAPTTLAPGQTSACSAPPYAITQSEVNTGAVLNTAYATATDPNDSLITSNVDDTATPVPARPGLRLVKAAGDPVDVNGSGITDAGDTIAYTFTITNTGNLPLTSISVADPRLLAQDGVTILCEATNLAPGANTTCTPSAPYRVTEQDEQAGAVLNRATAGGTPPSGGPVTSPPSSTTTPVTVPRAELVLDKRVVAVNDVNVSGLTDAGDTVQYAFTVANTGNVPVTDLVVTDPALTGLVCDAVALAPGESTTCAAAPYAITAGDVRAGAAQNTATAAADDPDGDPTTSPPDSTSVPTTTPRQELSIEKSAGAPVDVNDSGATDRGDTIVYTFTVTNTGNVPLTDVSVDDPKLAGLAITCATRSLAPGASVVCTAEPYAVSAADVAAGAVANSARALGTDPDGDPVTSPPDTTTTPVTPSAPALTVDKTVASLEDVNGSGITDAGDRITWSFAVTNTGNVPLRSVQVSDPLLTDAGGTIDCPPGRLAPGASVVCSATAYRVTQDDVEEGAVVNLARATAIDPDDAPVTSPPDTTSTPTTRPAPLLTIEKTAGTPEDVNGSGNADVGDRITYSFRVTNDGNVPLTAIEVRDPLLADADIDVACLPSTLAPGESAACTASGPLTITPANAAGGAVTNRATAAGTSPDGQPVESDPDTTTTPVIAPAPALSVLKTAGPVTDVNGSGITDAGDTIAYTFVVTNTGNVRLGALEIVDPRLAAQTDIEIVCDVTTLAAGASTTCRTGPATPYVVTEADERAGSVDNSARARGTDPYGEPVTSPPSTTSTPVRTPQPALAVDKQVAGYADVNGNGLTDAGDTLGFTFAITNTGNVPVSGVVVNDPRAAGAVCGETTLAPGASTSCGPVTVTITGADVAAGAVVNTATASGADPDGEVVTSPPDTTSTPTTLAQPGLVLDKTVVPGSWVDANASTIVDAGDVLSYGFTVRNTGNVAVDLVDVVDAKLEATTPVTCPPVRLAPGASVACGPVAYTVTSADVSTGAVDNTAIATGTPVGGGTVDSPPDVTSTPTTTPQPSLTLTKVADPATVSLGANASITDAGDTITYRFVVRNSGNVPIRGVTISDALLSGGTVVCDANASLAGVQPLNLGPGAIAECWGAPTSRNTYVLTQADVDRTYVRNVATARGTSPDGGPVTSPEADATTQITAQPAVTNVKAAWRPTDVNGSGITDAGDTVRFQFTVTNTGNVTLSNLVFDDPLLDDLGIAVVCEFPSGAPSTLAPGAWVRCVADQDYTITEDDEAAGHVVNVATVTVTPETVPPSPPVTSPPTTTSVPVATPEPRLAITKRASAPDDVNASGLTDAGDRIDFTFTVANTGNVPITDIVVDDPLLAQLPIVCDLVALTVTGPESSTECRATEPYVITAADVAAGAVVNVATASGEDPDGGAVRSPEDTTTTPTTRPQPALQLTKRVSAPIDRNGSTLVDAGDEVTFGFVVTNTGNVPITQVAIVDELLADAGVVITCTDGCGGPLAPGATRELISAPYRITAADVAARAVANTATAVGVDPDDAPVTSPPSTTTTPTTLPQPGISIDKAVDGPVRDVNGSQITDAGDRIAYTFTVTNTGNVPLRAVGVDDPMLDDAQIAVLCPAGPLAVGASVVCTTDAEYVVTAADEAAGAVTNEATARAQDPDGGVVTSSPDVTSVPTVAGAPALQVDKEVLVVDDVNGSGITDAGDTISYRFTITNTGNVPLDQVTVEDPLLAGGPGACGPFTLAAGSGPVTCDLGPYVITATDVDRGSVPNAALARGTDPDGDPVLSPPDTTSTPVTRPQPGLRIEKSAAAPVDVNDSGLTDAGDEITYSFEVTNVGNVPVDDIAVVDSRLTAQGITISCVPTRLAAGAVAACTTSGPYRVSAADVRDRSVANVAHAVGTDPDDGPVRSPDDTTTTPTTAPEPGLVLAKTAGTPVDVNDSGITDAGDRITFAFAVRNTGNVPLTDLTVADPMLAAVGITVACPPGRLEVGERADCVASAPYVVSAQDVADGAVANVATARAEDPDGGPVESPPDATSTPTTVPAPGLALDKSVDRVEDVNGNGHVDAGDRITFAFTVSNEGNVPIRQLAVSDPMLGAVTCDATSLAPGASTTCNAAPYEITQDDVNQASVINRAQVDGVDPDGGAVPPAEDTESVETTWLPALSLDKRAAAPVDVSGDDRIGAGDTIAYAFTVTNIGTVSIVDVTVVDPKVGAVACAAVRLEPGESTACTAAPYRITARDVARGTVDNVARAVGTAVGGGRVPSAPVESNPDQTATALVPVTSPDDPGTVETGHGGGDDSPLPDAGGFARGWVIFGAALLGAGIVLIAAGRRHHRRGESSS